MMYVFLSIYLYIINIVKSLISWQALLNAAKRGDLQRIHLLLQSGSSNVDARTSDGLTTLIYASSWGSTEVVRLLIDKKADVEARDINEMTALMYAVLNGRIDTVRLLTLKLEHFLNALSIYFHMHALIVRLLLDKGADINGKDKEGMTALLYAAQNGDMEMLKLLLNRSASIHVCCASVGVFILCLNVYIHESVHESVYVYLRSTVYTWIRSANRN